MIYKSIEDQKLAVKALGFMSERMSKTGASEPDMFHSVRVGLAGKNLVQTVVGFLHDTIEDTDCTKEDIAGVFGEGIAMKVEMLTNSGGGFYDDYIRRISLSDDNDVKEVKLNDLEDNIRRGFEAGLRCLVAKHLEAYRIILLSTIGNQADRNDFYEKWKKNLETTN